MSDDGQRALTLIAFIGSVFSPYYAAARRRGPADPTEHVALNVALYGPAFHRWAMTERGAGRLERRAERLVIGPSALAWRDDVLEIEIDEWCVPWPRRLRGQVRVRPSTRSLDSVALDAHGRHRWQAIAPCSRVEVRLGASEMSWQGSGYVDANWGEEPLEDAFREWQWSRTGLPGGDCLVHYDARRRDGVDIALALVAGREGVRWLPQGPAAREVDRTRWGLARRVHDGSWIRATLEDGPFYARSLLSTPWEGQQVASVHESLSLDRFGKGWVQALLPFRMPRRAGSRLSDPGRRADPRAGGRDPGGGR